MTEIPEHLLARSKQRRAALSGDKVSGEGGGEAAQPATVESSTPETVDSGDAAPPAVPARGVAPVAKPPEPTPPWVEAARKRKKIPVWAVPALVIIPFFFIVYALTLDEPTSTEGPLAMGEATFAVSCAGCHGATGGGGAGPQLSDGKVVTAFPRPVDQLTWVALGSAGYTDLGIKTVGADKKPINGGMPGQLDTLAPEDLMNVVLHERVNLGGETFDATTWEDGFEDEVKKMVPEHADEYIAVLDQWKTTPPTP